MNKTAAEAAEFFKEFSPIGAKVVICPPYTAIAVVPEQYRGAQNIHHEESGAYTGEVSGSMLREMRVDYVLVGHSERRTQFGESDELVAKKVTASLRHKITPVLCISDLSQLDILKNVDTSKIIVAYEPVWAIGTGKVATPEHIKEVHAEIRKRVKCPILYGGSANEKNAAEIMAIPNVDGVLVGGASLCPKKFSAIVNAAN